jgi:sodium transport system permease protein
MARMRWSIIRLIWARELRDQLRDRRTVFMIVVLPILLYPVLGVGVLQFASNSAGRANVIGVLGRENLPPWPPPSRWSPVPLAGAVGLCAPVPGDPLAPVTGASGAAGIVLPQFDPPLFLAEGDELRVPDLYLPAEEDAGTFAVRPLAGAVPPADPDERFLRGIDRRALDDKSVDVLLVIPPGFAERLAARDRPALYVLSRPGDVRSRLVDARLTGVLGRWQQRLRGARLLRQGLPPDFDEPVEVLDPEKDRPVQSRAAESLFETLGKIFPFILVMWSLAGALYPAVDLCAGEKERGTMETLLISPASREEIVWGKFLTIWVFSAATALLNLASIAVSTWWFSRYLPRGVFHPGPLLWGVVLLLPLSAFFSALCLAVGAYARSSKEGQYYLMPLFLVTMPLIFLTLAPGVELNAFWAMVPVTGVALLLQGLMAAGVPGAGLWAYFVPVLAPMVVYSWLALRWAIEQFNREEVLFREAERLDLGLWLRRLLREKEPLPSCGQAVFCFALVLALQWLALGLYAGVRPAEDPGRFLSLHAVGYLAFLATPPLLMAVVLTTRPLLGLGLRPPPWWSWPAAAALAAVLVLPLAALTAVVLDQFPDLRRSLAERVGPAAGAAPRAGPGGWLLLLVVGVLPAACEELAFRGFILTGLRRRFRPATALLLSSFLFAVYQMNVFQVLPHFALGLVLGLLALRTGSVLPPIFFHLLWNLFLLVPVFYPGALAPVLPGVESGGGPWTTLKLLCAAGGLAAAAPLLWLLWRRGPDGAADATPAAAPTPGAATLPSLPTPPAEVTQRAPS